MAMAMAMAASKSMSMMPTVVMTMMVVMVWRLVAFSCPNKLWPRVRLPHLRGRRVSTSLAPV